jgi:hypothetical protein
MRFDAWYIRQASRRHGGLGLLHRAHSESCIRTVQKNCFAAGAAIDQIMYFITLCGDTELRLKKIGRNSEGVLKMKTADVTMLLSDYVEYHDKYSGKTTAASETARLRCQRKFCAEALNP